MKELNIVATHATENSPFTVLQRDDEKYLLSLGNQIVSELEFDSVDNAKEYVNEKSWELIMNSVVYLINYICKLQENNPMGTLEEEETDVTI